MRVALACCLAVACSEPTYVPQRLPVLVKPRPPEQLPPIVVHELGLSVGEHSTWLVRVRGFTIGSVDLTVGEGEVRSKFATSMLATAFARVEHELVTTLDGSRPSIGRERLVFDGKTRQFSTTFAGTPVHSLHTALGAVRVWAHADAAAGYLLVMVADQKIRIELQEPSGGKDWLRVDGKLVGLDSPATFTCWLDAAHVITRIDIRADDEQVTAELVR